MGLFSKRKSGFASFLSAFIEIDEDFLEELEEKLILSDAGVETAEAAVEELRALTEKKGLQGEQIRSALADILTARLRQPGDASLRLDTKPSVILMVGVNGVGKTTTIGKLAKLLKLDGKRVLLCAADTFRAAASEQLCIWAERVGCEIIRHGEGGDPGAVVFDSCHAAKARGADVIIVDTAGRLHNKQNLMNELAKLRRIFDRELPGASVETLLVLDAATGQNGLIQAEQFSETAGITGIVLTKLDGTAKGGVVFSIADRLHVPVKFAGTGEGIDDIEPFEPRRFVEAMLS